MSINRRQIMMLGLSALASPLAWSDSNPPGMLRIVMPFPGGGALDAVARIFAETYRTTTGRNCIVENKPGASTIIGATDVMRSSPDGTTLLWTTGGHLTNAVLMKKLPFDPLADFTPVTMVYEADGFAMITRANGPYKTAADLIAAAKKSPGKISYASAGNGNTTHVVGALFAKRAGIELLHVPYKGTPLTDLISGVVDVTFVAASAVYQYVRSGKARALAITGPKRSDLLPDVPTLTELHLKDVEVPAWIGLLAPPKMTPQTLAALYDPIHRTVGNPNFVSRMKELGNNVSDMPPAKFTAYLEAELARYRRVLPPLGIEMDA